MTIEQLSTLIERHGPWVMLLIFGCIWFWVQGWPWLRKQSEIRAATQENRERTIADREAHHRREMAEQEAKHRADLMAIIAENSAYREKRLLVDQQVTTAINGVTEMVRQFQLVDRLNEKMSAIEEKLGMRDLNNDPKSAGRRG